MNAKEWDGFITTVSDNAWKFRLEELMKKLSLKGFEPAYSKDRYDAANAICEIVPDNSEVGIGGSMTVRQSDIIAKLKEKGCDVLVHSPEMTHEESLEVRKRACMSTFYICSANAVTMNGEIVNTDGYGNRIAGTSFGPERAILLIGRNKIVADIESAFFRIKHFATPPNAARLNMPLPCASSGYCSDCENPACIIRVTSILHMRPFSTAVSVVLVNEDLGF